MACSCVLLLSLPSFLPPCFYLSSNNLNFKSVQCSSRRVCMCAHSVTSSSLQPSRLQTTRLLCYIKVTNPKYWSSDLINDLQKTAVLANPNKLLSKKGLNCSQLPADFYTCFFFSFFLLCFYWNIICCTMLCSFLLYNEVNQLYPGTLGLFLTTTPSGHHRASS